MHVFPIENLAFTCDHGWIRSLWVPVSSGRTATSRDPAAAVSRTSFAGGVLRRRREGEAGGEVGWAGDGAAARVAQEERRRGRVGNFLACFTLLLSKNKILYKPISIQIISNKAVIDIKLLALDSYYRN